MLEETYKKAEVALKGYGFGIFPKAKAYIKQSRNFIIAKGEYSKVYLDIIKYHYDILKECKKAIERQDDKTKRVVLESCNDLQSYIAERFMEYYNQYIKLKGLENELKVRVNEFVNYRQINPNTREIDAVLSMADKPVIFSSEFDDLVKNMEYIKSLLKIPFIQITMFAKNLNVAIVEIDEVMAEMGIE